MEKINVQSSPENIRTLTDLGLKSAQAKIYLTLLSLGPTSISKIALASQVARPDTYRDLSELQELGIVEKIVASPTEVKPLPIEDAITILMLRKTKENLDLNKRATKLVEVIKKETNEKQHTENNQFALIQGDAIDFEFQRSMFESKKNVCIIGSSRKILQGIINHHEAFLNALRRKVNIRIVTEELHGFDPPKKVKVLQKFPNFEWRYLIDTPAVWLKIYDSQKNSSHHFKK
ncbi:MAG: TrmB family transcriptional regulator [Candidatus Bathyarchaeia archaeon]